MTIEYEDDNNFSPIPCPNCGSKVEITNSRDCRILTTSARCTNYKKCEGDFFSTESEATCITPDNLMSDSEIVAIKYYNWASKKEAAQGYRCNGEWD